MRRLLLNLLLKVATVLSLVLCLATVGGWMRNDGIAIDLDRWWLLWDSDPGVVSVYWHSDGPANLRLPFSALLLLSLLVPILRLGLTMKSRRHTPAGFCPT